MSAFSKRSLIALAAGLIAAGTAVGAQAQSRITIGTNPAGTMYFVVGGGISKLLSDKLDVKATAQPYAGSSVYLPLVQSGEVTMGFSSTIDSGMAYGGVGPYEKGGALKGLRAVTQLWPLPYAFFAKASSGMKSVSDLKGRKVAVNFKANASLRRANRAMLLAGGVDPDKDVTAITVSGLPEGYKGVTEGRFEAAATALAIPLARKANASIPGGIVILDVSGKNATTDFISKQMPGLYITKSKPSKNKPGVEKEISVVGFDIFLVIGKDVSEERAYEITKTIHQNWGDLQEKYRVLKRNSVNKLASPTNTIPYHPGAVRYYKEAGLWTAANDAREKALK